MKTQNTNSIKIDKRLERFRGRILFPEKVELAKKILANAKLPELPENQ